MSKTKKILLTATCALLLVVGSVMGTMAYFTDTASVLNTFTVGKVGITLDEAKVDEYGTALTPAKRTSDGNAYKLIPGHTYIKDPIIHVDADSEDCWLFVKVENGIKNIEAATVAGGYTNIADQLTKDGCWSLVAGQSDVYAYKEKVSKGSNIATFTQFKIDGDKVVGGTGVDTDTTKYLDNYARATVKVTAYAVQADGFDTSADAWTKAGLQ